MMVDRRLAVAPVLICLAVSAGVPAATPAEQSTAARQSVSRGVPSWVTRPPADDQKDHKFVGTATSASSSQASGAAYDDAVRKAVVRIGTRLFQDRSVTTWYGLDALRKYVRQVAQNAGQYIQPNAGSGYTAHVLLLLNRGFVEPSAVRRYVPAAPAMQQQTAAAVGYLLVPSDIGPAGVSRRTQVRMPDLRQGNFYLSFTAARTKGQLWLRLDQIQVLDDGSAGTTRWTFDVSVNGRPAFRTPVTAYTDDVVTYRMRAGDRNVETQTAPADGLNEIRIAGTRSSAASGK